MPVVIRLIALLGLLWWSNASLAQDKLRLTNTSKFTIVMKYLPCSMRPNEMLEKEIPVSVNGSETEVDLYDGDPYDVTFYLKPETKETAQGFRANVGRPIALRSLARQGRVFDLRLALASIVVQGNIRHEAMNAILTSGNQSTEVFGSREKISNFGKKVLAGSIQTEFRAGNNNIYEAMLNLKTMTFSTDRFDGKLTNVAVFDDEKSCYLVGNWTALDSKGDFFFNFEKADGTPVLKGEYTFEGKPDRFFWQSK